MVTISKILKNKNQLNLIDLRFDQVVKKHFGANRKPSMLRSSVWNPMANSFAQETPNPGE